MKTKLLLLSGVLALGLAATGANAQTINDTTFNTGGPGQGYVSGDLILGFYNVNGSESADLVLISAMRANIRDSQPGPTP